MPNGFKCLVLFSSQHMGRNYYVHFKDEEVGSLPLSNLPTITEPERNLEGSGVQHESKQEDRATIIQGIVHHAKGELLSPKCRRTKWFLNKKMV